MKNSRALTAVLRPASALHAATLDLEILCGIKDEFLAGGLRPLVQAQIPSDLRRSDIKVTVF